MKKSLYIILLLMSVVLVGCKKGSTTKLETSVTELFADAKGDRKEIPFTCNGSWSARCSATWVEMSPVMGEAGDCHTTAVISSNDSGEERTANILLICNDVTVKIAVTQEAKVLDNEGDDSYHLDSFEQDFEVNVLSNVEYHQEIKDKWVKFVKTKAATRNTFVFHADANTVDEDRKTTISFKSDDGLSFSVDVFQEKPAIITFENDHIEIDQFGGPVNIVVSSNVKPEVNIPETADWVKMNETKVIDFLDYSFSVAENDDPSPRDAEIKFSHGRVSNSLFIHQAGMPTEPFMKLPGGNACSISSDAQEYCLTVQTNVEFTVESSADWAEIKEIKRTGATSVVTIDVDSFALSDSVVDSFHDRNAEIVVKEINGDLSQTLVLTQNPEPYSMLLVAVPMECTRQFYVKALGQSVDGMLFDQWFRAKMDPVFNYMIEQGYGSIPLDVYLRGADGFSVPAVDGMYIDFSKF